MQGIQTIAQQLPLRGWVCRRACMHATCQLSRRTPAKAAMPDCRLAAASCQLFSPATWTPEQRTPKLSGTWTNAATIWAVSCPAAFPAAVGSTAKVTC